MNRAPTSRLGCRRPPRPRRAARRRGGSRRSSERSRPRGSGRRPTRRPDEASAHEAAPERRASSASRSTRATHRAAVLHCSVCDRSLTNTTSMTLHPPQAFIYHAIAPTQALRQDLLGHDTAPVRDDAVLRRVAQQQGAACGNAHAHGDNTSRNPASPRTAIDALMGSPSLWGRSPPPMGSPQPMRGKARARRGRGLARRRQ